MSESVIRMYCIFINIGVAKVLDWGGGYERVKQYIRGSGGIAPSDLKKTTLTKDRFVVWETLLP